MHEVSIRGDGKFLEAILCIGPRSKGASSLDLEHLQDNPFDARLGTHRINSLSAHYKRTVYSVVIEADLRVVFFLEGGTVQTIDIGNHAIYK